MRANYLTRCHTNTISQLSPEAFWDREEAIHYVEESIEKRRQQYFSSSVSPQCDFSDGGQYESEWTGRINREHPELSILNLSSLYALDEDVSYEFRISKVRIQGEEPEYSQRLLDAIEEAELIANDPNVPGYTSIEELKKALEE